MGDCVRNCKRVAVMESSSTATTLTKRLKMDFDFEEIKFSSQSFNRLIAMSSSAEADSPATSANSGRFLTGDAYSADYPPSFCSSNESSEVVKDSLRLLDLEVKSFETESSTCISNNFSRETTPCSEVCGDADGMEKPAVTKNTCQRIREPAAAAKMPSHEEIDEFFAEAEKGEQKRFEEKRFEEKYNYDIAKDAPLEGRYQWVGLKP